MSEFIGADVFAKLQSENTFQISDSELIKRIAFDLKAKPDEWNGLSFLNSPDPNNWDRLLYKVISFSPSGWETSHRQVVEFVKVLRYNWSKSIPELLETLDKHSIGVDDFFKLERKVTFKLSSLLSDINILQKEILNANDDISRFINWASNAFLPPVVYELEEFGLPRMITKKIHKSKYIDFTDKELNIHIAIEMLNEIGINKIKEIENLTFFDNYILDYFYDGIKKNEKQ